MRALGIAETHIASSRELTFESRVLAATAGRGVDVVLNSLAREFVDASLRLLPRGGRFLEMGKTDIREPAAIAAAHPAVAYRAFDLGEAGLDRIQQMLVAGGRAVRAGCAQAVAEQELGRATSAGGLPVCRRRRDTSAKWS